GEASRRLTRRRDGADAPAREAPPAARGAMAACVRPAGLVWTSHPIVPSCDAPPQHRAQLFRGTLLALTPWESLRPCVRQTTEIVNEQAQAGCPLAVHGAVYGGGAGEPCCEGRFPVGHRQLPVDGG